jgi:hypothetical protein
MRRIVASKNGYKDRPALRKHKGRTAIYGGEVVELLKQIWEIYVQISRSRLDRCLAPARFHPPYERSTIKQAVC